MAAAPPAQAQALAIPEKDLLALPEADRAVVLDYRARAEAILTDAKELQVVDEDTKVQAVEALSGVARVKREADAKRDDLVRPLNDRVRIINSVFRLVLAPVLEADGLLRGKVRDHDREVARRAAEAAAEVEAAKVRAEALLTEAAKADAAGETVAADQLFNRAVEAEKTAKTTAAAAPAPPSRVVRTDLGTVSTRKRWTFEVTDKATVPLEYLVVDDVAVRKKIADGVREIPGLRIYQEESLAVRG
jgi:hypothetical protein